MNRNRSRADARTHSNLSNSRAIELERYSRVRTSVDRSTPKLARRVEYAHRKFPNCFFLLQFGTSSLLYFRPSDAMLKIFKRTKKREKKRNRNSYPLRSARVRLNGERGSLGDGGSFRDGNFRANERG